MSLNPSSSEGSLNRRPKSPKAMPGSDVLDSGFCVQFSLFLMYVHMNVSACVYVRVTILCTGGRTYQITISSTDGVVMLAQLWGREEEDAADGDVKFFG